MERYSKFFYTEKVCILFLSVGLLAFAAQKGGILRDLWILSACSLSWKMVRAQFTAVNGFFRQNCVLLHSAGRWCCLEATKVKSTILHQIIDATSESCGTYQMKNNHVGKQRPCFCNLRNIIPNSGILVYPIIINNKPLLWLLWIAYYWVYHMRISLRHTSQRVVTVVTAQKPLKTPFFFATPCRWDAPKVCPKWVTWRNRKLIAAQNGGCGKGL